MGMDDWSDDRVALLRKLIESGASCGETATAINTETGAKFTRNAIIGKVQRMGLKSPNKRGETVKAKRRPRGEGRKIKLRNPAPTQAPAFKPEPPKPQDVIPPKTFKVRELFGTELDGERCSYDQACTEPPIRGRFFCAAHCQIVYRPPTQPKNPQRPHQRPTRR